MEAKVKMKRALMFVVLGIAVIGEAAITTDVPSITFLTGSGPEVLRQAGPGAASLDLGRIAFYERMTAPAARMNNRTEATGRFRIQVSSGGKLQRTGTLYAVAPGADSAVELLLDGVRLSSAPQMVGRVRSGGSSEHRVTLVIPVTAPPGQVFTAVIFTVNFD